MSDGNGNDPDVRVSVCVCVRGSGTVDVETCCKGQVWCGIIVDMSSSLIRVVFSDKRGLHDRVAVMTSVISAL